MHCDLIVCGVNDSYIRLPIAIKVPYGQDPAIAKRNGVVEGSVTLTQLHRVAEQQVESPVAVEVGDCENMRGEELLGTEIFRWLEGAVPITYQHGENLLASARVWVVAGH